MQKRGSVMSEITTKMFSKCSPYSPAGEVLKSIKNLNSLFILKTADNVQALRGVTKHKTALMLKGI